MQLDTIETTDEYQKIYDSISWDKVPDILDEISKYIFTSKYARFRSDLQRRETWDEAVTRVEDMHLKKYNFLDEKDAAEIQRAFNLVRSQAIVPSMRSMQFGGPAVEAHNARIFNCSVRHIDSVRAFAESFYLLLCGCGVGLGLTRKYLNRLPDLVSDEDKTGTVITYVVEDNIEGWADSAEALLNCYFKGNAYSGRRIIFDYSRIRRKGTPLKVGGGKAPGYKPLKAAHQKIKKLLDNIIEEDGQSRMKSINAYDIVMHLADAVLSGGVRRSATSVMFDKDDEDMLNAKTGDWNKKNPQRGRSNNSVLLLRNEVSLEEFRQIVQRTREWGEPGFVFTEDEDGLFNPCQPGWAPILTKKGIRTIGDLTIGDQIWSETGWTNVVKKWSTGVKKVYRYQTTAGVFYGTENHKLVSNGVKVEAKDCETVDVLPGPYRNPDRLKHMPDDMMAGLMIGDGGRNHKTGKQVFLHIGQDDQDYFNSEVAPLIGDAYPEAHKTLAWHVFTDIEHEELLPLPERIIPDRYLYGNKAKVAGFLRGLYSANGSVVAKGARITLKTSSPKLREQVQLMLSSLGIRSYFTTNKSKDVEFANGIYTCKESYDINITSDRHLFAAHVGFLQVYKNQKVNTCGAGHPKKNSFDVISVELVSEEEVFDLTVDNDPHTYWTGGLNVSNCYEVSFVPVTEDGVCGVQMCNLSSINGSKVISPELFYEYAEAAAIIGTLQAGYTNFPYLSKTAQQLTEAEALLGVSITAMMDNPQVLLDPVIQQTASRIVVETNKVWADKLGINQAARATVIKPEGTSTLALGSMASGIHPAHAHTMLRRVQANKTDNAYNFFKQWNPHVCEESVYSEYKTDDVIAFPVVVPSVAMVKADLDALGHLDIIKSTQENWVIPGTTEANTKNVHHNVSCTVVVREHEWDLVIDYLYRNRGFFAAVALLPASGDKDYPQAPNEAMVTVEDIQKFKDYIHNWIPVDYTLMKETSDQTSLMEEVSCAGPLGCETR